MQFIFGSFRHSFLLSVFESDILSILTIHPNAPTFLLPIIMILLTVDGDMNAMSGSEQTYLCSITLQRLGRDGTEGREGSEGEMRESWERGMREMRRAGRVTRERW